MNYVKRFAAKSWTENRKVPALIDHLKTAFYGGTTAEGNTAWGVDGTPCRSFIDHGLRKIAEAADQDEELETK